MNEEWLDIQGFVTDHEVLQAVNDLSIATKLQLDGVVDEDRERRAHTARECLRSFLRQLSDVLGSRRECDDVITGVDPNLSGLIDAYESARRKVVPDRSALLQGGPDATIALLDAKDTPSRRALVEALADLRQLVSRHQQTRAIGIFEEF